MTIPTPKAKTSALNLVFYSFLYDLARKVTSLKLQKKHVYTGNKSTRFSDLSWVKCKNHPLKIKKTEIAMK